MRKPTRRICSTGAAGAKQSWGGIVALPLAAAGHQGVDPFDRLPDDLVIAVLAGLAAGATCPADLAAAALTLVTLRPPCSGFLGPSCVVVLRSLSLYSQVPEVP